MGNDRILAQRLARRHKRLLYWQELFSKGGLSEEQAETFKQLFATYRLLVSKVIMAREEQEREECEERLVSMDRLLTSLFESRRLLTSTMGISAIS